MSNEERRRASCHAKAILCSDLSKAYLMSSTYIHHNINHHDCHHLTFVCGVHKSSITIFYITEKSIFDCYYVMPCCFLSGKILSMSGIFLGDHPVFLHP